ncbi:restriction endonuclease subunit S, partial [bacterium]|nr:restriction endonuclease subunit S [bacterium]
MKQGWKIKKLGEVLSLEYGKPLPKEKRIHKGLYPVYGANGIINRTNEYYVDETSIIVGRKGSAGEINYTEEKFWPLDVTYYTKFDKNELNLNFLYYLLSLLELPKLAKGVKPGINRNDIYAIKTFIPFLSEQKRIVSKLDQCFEAIDKAKANVERNRQNAKELFQSKLNQIFSQKGDGWVEKKLGEVCEKTTNIKWQENQGVEFEYIDLTAVSRDSLQITETVTVNLTNAPSRAKKIIKTNDVIFATTRPTLKRVVKITNQFDNQICSTGFVVLRSKKDVIESEIIFYFLQTDIFMDRMESIQRGTSYPAVT